MKCFNFGPSIIFAKANFFLKFCGENERLIALGHTHYKSDDREQLTFKCSYYGHQLKNRIRDEAITAESLIDKQITEF